MKQHSLWISLAIYSTALDMTDAANAFAAEGNVVDHDALATIRRLGDLVLDLDPLRGTDHPAGPRTPCAVPRRPSRLAGPDVLIEDLDRHLERQWI
jgi:hypothetical protein